ncbi:PREDICTED: uncharacterized protein LOC104806535 [Tarenaya hassleriana]|uniref:uncharacterized protein LOC104806535 n=1 Tax=Tarenaya hassleriana TaxID=28532 RepID=UPI00053C883B|nr:PREDICTED: uncharacterized protein LOC104806535 [Tarenaya hassleriana]XP_010529784.1 PREDICTED: uncharacterized protein LOC104806535 [Tarenaya hassleriana]
MSEDRFPSCQSRGSVEHRGRFKGKARNDAKVRDCEKGKVMNKDEVVRYMLNPPGYLHGKERSENFQGKALSVGVLDWERLERWKQTAAEETKGSLLSDASSSGVITSSEETAFTSLSRSSSVSATSCGYGEGNHFSTCSGASLSHKSKHFREYESACQGKWEEKKRVPWDVDSFNRDYSGLSGRLVRKLELDQKFRPRLENFSPDTRHHSLTLRSRKYANAIDTSTKKRTEPTAVKADVNKKRFDKILTLHTAAIQSGKEDVSNAEWLKASFRTEESTSNGTTEIDLSHQSQQRKPKNIVLLRPNKYAANCHGEKHQASLDKNLLEEMQSKVSTEFLRQEDNHSSEEFLRQEDNHSSELRSRIPHSCPLLFSHQTNAELETSSEPLSSEASKTVECQDNGSGDTEGKCSKPIYLEDGNQKSVGNPCVLGQEIPKVVSRRGRHALPNRGSSFSFSQMGRSFSFKETSSVPSSSSPPHVVAKSGLLTSGTSVYSNGKQKGHNRTKSSPLRRMIDPLLKPNHETRVPNPRPNKSPENEKKMKQENSTVRALLQFTERKGVHLFQFVVDNNNNNVLAATLKSSDSSTKFYTFYSVQEVRKKSAGWLLGQGNKDKSHGFTYMIIGHMRTSTTFSSDFTTRKSESVLLDVETNHEDQTMEVAAIVDEMDCSSNPDSDWNTKIILPGGIHTLPKDGNALLPLVDRWKSGGTCDCGGWDVGCKLRVLSYGHSNHFSKGSNSKPRTSNGNSFQFFDQESDKPTLTLVSLGDGLHSVEFDASVSLLLAFFISLTISSREESLVIGDGHIKHKPPIKYASYPPVSPVGRV